MDVCHSTEMINQSNHINITPTPYVEVNQKCVLVLIVSLFVAVGRAATEEDAFDGWTCITYRLFVLEFIHSLQV